MWPILLLFQIFDDMGVGGNSFLPVGVNLNIWHPYSEKQM
jgi:hypothetical protein